MFTKGNTYNALVLSYLALRKSIGTIGIALPFVLVTGKMLFAGPGILDSISGYYYSVMRDVFVGSLWAIAVFLLSYRGYDWLDDLASDFAGICAIGIALFPTTPNGQVTETVGILHFSFATGFMLTLAFFALVLFRKTDQNKPPTRRKLQRNSIYLASGITIIACLVSISLILILPNHLLTEKLHPVFWLESAAIIAFGISWFVKGETILQDEEEQHSQEQTA